MNTTDKNEEVKSVELKVPFFIPIIILVIIGIICFKIYEPKIQAKDTMQEKGQEVLGELEENQDEVKEDEKTETNGEDGKMITYTAPNGEKYDVIATLSIPILNIKYPVLSDTSEDLLKVSLNKYWGPNPNEEGNLVILGHNYENTKFFSKLPKINIGDIVEITDMDGKTLQYKVYETDVIHPDNNDCTSQLTNGNTEITLITCVNKGLQRFYAKARAN